MRKMWSQVGSQQTESEAVSESRLPVNKVAKGLVSWRRCPGCRGYGVRSAIPCVVCYGRGTISVKR